VQKSIVADMKATIVDEKLRRKFGERIRQLRKEKGWSQEELGFQSKLHRTYIGSVERGEQNVSLDNIGRLAKTLKVKASDLFDKLS
jgi:transcriptional regulator with XRE-family HTH domain